MAILFYWLIRSKSYDHSGEIKTLHVRHYARRLGQTVEENRQAPYLHGAKSPVEERDIK